MNVMLCYVILMYNAEAYKTHLNFAGKINNFDWELIKQHKHGQNMNFSLKNILFMDRIFLKNICGWTIK